MLPAGRSVEADRTQAGRQSLSKSSSATLNPRHHPALVAPTRRQTSSANLRWKFLHFLHKLEHPLLLLSWLFREIDAEASTGSGKTFDGMEQKTRERGREKRDRDACSRGRDATKYPVRYIENLRLERINFYELLLEMHEFLSLKLLWIYRIFSTCIRILSRCNRAFGIERGKNIFHFT